MTPIQYNKIFEQFIDDIQNEKLSIIEKNPIKSGNRFFNKAPDTFKIHNSILKRKVI